ncbi:unnamed protein product [Symbiodinium natans]|uniref:Pentatricopeptide repeat-containing protein n=1 Tax=Symbiodinium natans TaxID=878477 RepID=A0A812KE44_9DINO|nr:unnamed protein product [Symbiodinium natans]
MAPWLVKGLEIGLQALWGLQGELHLGVLAKRLQWQAAVSVLFEAVQGRMVPHLSSCSACIKACGQARQWQLALQLLSHMPGNLRPNVISWNSAIGACDRGRQWQLCLQLFAEMPAARVARDVISHSSDLNA